MQPLWQHATDDLHHQIDGKPGLCGQVLAHVCAAEHGAGARLQRHDGGGTGPAIKRHFTKVVTAMDVSVGDFPAIFIHGKHLDTALEQHEEAVAKLRFIDDHRFLG